MTRIIFEKDDGDGRTIKLYGKDTGDLEIFVDGAWGLTFINGVCKLNLFTVAPDAEGEPERREVAARISMALPTFFSLRDLLVSQCEDLEQRFGLRTESTEAELKPEESAEAEQKSDAKPKRRKKD